MGTFRDANYNVILTGIAPKVNYEVRYDGICVTRKITATSRYLKISATNSYPLTGNIEIVGLGKINLGLLSRATVKPKFDKTGELVSGGISNQSFLFENSAYILGASKGTKYDVKYLNNLKVRKLKTSNKGELKIKGTSKWPQGSNTVLYLGTGKNYLAIGSLPLLP